MPVLKKNGIRSKNISSSLSSFSSAQISSVMSQEVETFSQEISGPDNSTGLHRPPELIKWIRSKDDIDNVYLVPRSDEKESTHYLYEVVTSEEANATTHFLTLRYGTQLQDTISDSLKYESILTIFQDFLIFKDEKLLDF